MPGGAQGRPPLRHADDHSTFTTRVPLSEAVPSKAKANCQLPAGRGRSHQEQNAQDDLHPTPVVKSRRNPTGKPRADTDRQLLKSLESQSGQQAVQRRQNQHDDMRPLKCHMPMKDSQLIQPTTPMHKNNGLRSSGSTPSERMQTAYPFVGSPSR